MCDLIRRQDAIDAHYEYCNKHPDAGFPVWSLKILENLPSAQPKHDISKAKFSCPICGAEMEVTVDEWDEGGAV